MIKAMRARKAIKEWRKQYMPLAPKAGDIAPDFELYDVNGRNQIRLSEFRGKKPVALIFGSYT